MIAVITGGGRTDELGRSRGGIPAGRAVFLAALAEVSDKVPAPDLFWVVGLAASTVCLVGARLKPWLGAACFVPAALWFIGLLAELHAVDIASHLVAERGTGYYVQAYAAFGLVCGGFAMGWRWHRRSARASCAAEKR